MIRPEVLQMLNRWREALAGAAAAGLGLYWTLGTGGGILSWIGWIVLAGGLALAWTGVQRGRFRLGGGGPGVVRIVEGRIAYFGPLSGGIVDTGTMTALTLDPTGHPVHWIIERPGEPPLAIPLTATGADQLFDAFAALDGLQSGRLTRALETVQTERRPIPLWRRQDTSHARVR